jgi:alkylated DNA repair dioxygenase AlkB
MTKMIDVPVRNPEILECLNNYVSIKDIDNFSDNMRLVGQAFENRRDYYIGDAHRRAIMTMGAKHDGYPEALRAYDMKFREKHQMFSDKADAMWRTELLKKLGDCNQKLVFNIGAKNNALTALYPPGGFISWHNNANASAYNIIFTWSETGDGWFKFVEPETGEVVTVQDRPGWQCKAFYFGNYSEPSEIIYHAASTDCWRMTVSFMFDRADLSYDFRQEIIEEISSE